MEKTKSQKIKQFIKYAAVFSAALVLGTILERYTSNKIQVETIALRDTEAENNDDINNESNRMLFAENDAENNAENDTKNDADNEEKNVLYTKKPETESKININTASAKELNKLNGVGESTAMRIIEYRNQNGPFKTIENIMDVSGIGQKTFEGFKDKICTE